MFDLGQMIFYIRDNKVHSAPVLSRMSIENMHDERAQTETQRKLFAPFGASRVFYGTCHGIIPGPEAYGSRQDLINSL